MQESFKPDKKYFIKILLILVTVSVAVLILSSLLHFIITANNGDAQAMRTLFIIWTVVISALALMWLLAPLLSYLWVKNLSYSLLTDRVQIHKGILTKTRQNIPLRAITDFALERSLYDRFLGIGAIKIQTAGQSHNPSGYEGKLSGLTAFEHWHEQLHSSLKTLHPLAEAVTTAESGALSDHQILAQILEELRGIRKNTAAD